MWVQSHNRGIMCWFGQSRCWWGGSGVDWDRAGADGVEPMLMGRSFLYTYMKPLSSVTLVPTSRGVRHRMQVQAHNRHCCRLARGHVINESGHVINESSHVINRHWSCLEAWNFTTKQLIQTCKWIARDEGVVDVLCCSSRFFTLTNMNWHLASSDSSSHLSHWSFPLGVEWGLKCHFSSLISSNPALLPGILKWIIQCVGEVWIVKWL